MGALAAALPGAAASLDLDHVQLRVVDRAADRRADLPTTCPAEAREPVFVPDDACDHEVHPTARVRHPLDHVHIEDLVLRFGKEDVHDLRLSDRQAGPDRFPPRRELAAQDEPAELRLRDPLAQIPLRTRASSFAPSAPPSPPRRHQGASSFPFTSSKSFGIASPMWVPRIRSLSGRTPSP